MPKTDDRIIVALDVDTLDQARSLVERLYPRIRLFKVGSQLFTAYGPEAVRMVGERGGGVFLDLKFHDIPQTVSSAASAAAGYAASVFMITVHSAGGSQMLRAALRGAQEKAEQLNRQPPRVVGVTVLTSDAQESGIEKVVLERAKLAQDAGLDGVVCSAHEAAAVRKACGKEFIIVTPGIRPKAAHADDQQRVATVEAAVRAGSDYLVIGRPIVKAADPARAAEEFIAALQSARAAL